MSTRATEYTGLMVTIKAPAKVNLTLEVIGSRSDGYHEVSTILQTIDLCDTIDLEPAKSLTLDCSDPRLKTEENAVWKTATLLREVYQVTSGVHIRLKKVIPQSAGLGGGSSDSAAVLRGLNRLWDLHLSNRELEQLGAQLGSDIPFFVQGGTALARGRGEIIEPLPSAQIPWVLVACPPVPTPPQKTAQLYQSLTTQQYTTGMATQRLANKIRTSGCIPTALIYNTFDAIASQSYPNLDVLWRAFQELSPEAIHLCGSGPAMFTLLSKRDEALRLLDLLTSLKGWTAYIAQPHLFE